MSNLVSENINFDLVFKKMEVLGSLDDVPSTLIKEEPKRDKIDVLKEKLNSEQEFFDVIAVCNQLELLEMLQREEMEKGRDVYERLLLESDECPVLRRTFM